jgi:tetratricopeptide (TPR) repeat protein
MAPSGFFGLINFANLYTRLRRADVAARLIRGILDTTYSRLSIANSNLVRTLLTFGKVEDAKVEYRRMLLHADSNEANVSLVRYLVATATRNWPALQILANDELAKGGAESRRLGRQYAREAALVQGQFTRYDSLVRADTLRPSPTSARVRAEVLGDTAAARRMIEPSAEPARWASREPIDRPYATTIAALALVGDTTRAEAIAADWATHMPQAYKLRDSLAVLSARAELALARGKPGEALRLLRLADVKGCAACLYPRYARIFDALHMPDSVATYYEKYATATIPGNANNDAYELARAYRRLGEVYEERRDWKRATQRYQDFVILWEHADPSLQPMVKDVRARIERMRTKTG